MLGHDNALERSTSRIALIPQRHAFPPWVGAAF